MLTLIAQAATEAVPTEGLAALGFDGWALLFQIVNFAIILFVLRIVAYKPILKVLETRRQKIEESLKASTEMETIKKELTEERKKMIQKTQHDMQQVLSQGKEQAEQIVKNAHEKARQQGEQMVEKARTQAQQELRQLKDEFKKEAITLVALATEKIISEKLDPKADEALIEHALRATESETQS